MVTLSLSMMLSMITPNFASAAGSTPNVEPARVSYDVSTGKFSEKVGQIVNDDCSDPKWQIDSKLSAILRVGSYVDKCKLPSSFLDLKYQETGAKQQLIKCDESLKDWIIQVAADAVEHFRCRQANIIIDAELIGVQGAATATTLASIDITKSI